MKWVRVAKLNKVLHFLCKTALTLHLAMQNNTTNFLADNCFLEFSVKVLRVMEPPEDRMEKALFSPPLSKQRVEFAVRHINESQATTLVIFAGSGCCEYALIVSRLIKVDLKPLNFHLCCIYAGGFWLWIGKSS